MFVVNPFRAVLRRFNRINNTSIYDDQNYDEISIKICPYNKDEIIKFGIDTRSEATGYFQVSRFVDIREGDQVIYKDKTYTVIEVKDNFLFNRIENFIIVCK